MSRKKTNLTADLLQEIFMKKDSGGKTRQELMKWYAVPSLDGYFTARSQYVKGKPIRRKIVSVKSFTDWAKKYGGKGDPKWVDGPIRKDTVVKKESDRKVKYKIEVIIWEYN